MYRLLALLFVGAAVALSSSLQAQSPELISYQGYLTNSSGTPLDGTYDLSFSLHTGASRQPGMVANSR